MLHRKRRNLFSLIYLSGQYLLYCGVSALQSVLNLISLTVICFSSLLMIQTNSTGLSISKHLCHFSYFKVTDGKVFYTLYFFVSDGRLGKSWLEN
jgi:hypothetical protein